MSIGNDLLTKVTAESTLLNSCLALLQGLIDAGTIPADTLTQINAQIQGQEDAINSAMVANTPH